MHNLVTAPIRASRHLAIWIVWQSTGVTRTSKVSATVHGCS